MDNRPVNHQLFQSCCRPPHRFKPRSEPLDRITVVNETLSHVVGMVSIRPNLLDTVRTANLIDLSPNLAEVSGVAGTNPNVPSISPMVIRNLLDLTSFQNVG